MRYIENLEAQLKIPALPVENFLMLLFTLLMIKGLLGIVILVGLATGKLVLK